MPLPSLEWRKLPTRNLNVTSSQNSILSTIFDMLTGSLYHDGSTRIINSGSAWSASKFTTGSNVEAVWCRPPLNTVVSQSIIFSARSSTAPSSSATPPSLIGSYPGRDPTLGTPQVTNPTTYSSSVIHVACVKNASGSFTEWTSLYPFGSGSISTGYARANALFTPYTTIIVYESKEALFLNFTNTNVAIPQGVGMRDNVMGCLAGAIIDPEDITPTSSFGSEIDGRLYGVAITGVSTSNAEGVNQSQVPSATANWLGIRADLNDVNFNLTGKFLRAERQSDLTNSNTRFFIFNPRINSGNILLSGGYPNPLLEVGMMATSQNADKNIGNAFLDATGLYQNYYMKPSGKFILNPIYLLTSGFNNIVASPTSTIDYFVGRLREVLIVKTLPTNTVIRDSSNNIIGFTFSGEIRRTCNTILLKY